MQVTETSSEGLKRTLRVVVGADEIGERFSTHLVRLKDQVQIKGFRKGKVPVSHIKKVFGRSVMSDVLQEAIRDTSNKAIADRKERPAMLPNIELPKEQGDIERVLAGESDLAYDMTFEVLPEVRIADFSNLKLERLVADVDDASVDEAVGKLAERNKTYTAEEGRAVGDGDRVTIDFAGSIDGEPFEGGKGENLSLVIGNASFIPGFEDGLKGATKGERRDVKGTFPDDYPVATLAGKEATFDVTVKEVEKPVPVELSDAFAASIGVESLDNLKQLIKSSLQTELEGASRQKLKRELLDELEKAHDFELPASLVEREFESIWQQVQQQAREGKSFADEGKTEDEAREEFRRIAARRVRLGLVVGELGDKNKIEVTQDELRRALMEEARRYPGQEKKVYEFFEKTPGALQQLRAPIFEDKVIDFILSQVKPVERKVSREELTKSAEEVANG